MPSDLFCWICAKKNTTVKCSKCERTYHKKCYVRAANNNDDNWECDECNHQDNETFK